MKRVYQTKKEEDVMKSNLRIMRAVLLGVLLAVFLAGCGGSGGGGTSTTTTTTAPTVPSAPTGVSATAGNSQVTISWSAVSGATSYNIYWSTTSGVTKTSGTKISGVTSPYSQTGRTNGTPYYYIVTAVNSSGESAVSAQVTATPAGAWPSEGIIFIRWSNDSWTNAIWVMNTDGSNPRRLATVSNEYLGDQYPSSSPDGSKIVFIREGKGIVVLDSSGERIAKSFSYTDTPKFTTWSYNGKIYFTGWDAAHQRDFVYSINSDGTGQAQVSPAWASIDEPNDYHPSVSPDGLNLLFSTNRTGNGGTIAKMAIGGSSMTYLTYTGGPVNQTYDCPALHPTWSPNGSKIAFAAWPGYSDNWQTEQIYVMNADGSGKQKLTNETTALCSFPAWSPDGTKIVFQKDYQTFSNPLEIWIMNADGTGQKALTDRNVTIDGQPCFIKKPR